MTSLHDPLALPNGQVLSNRIMKAAMSEARADRRNAPDDRLERLYATGSGVTCLYGFRQAVEAVCGS